jgi:hypothetical protein
MSSQGPSLSGTATTIAFAANPTGTRVPRGYTFSLKSVRDSSDWIALKKQTLILKEDKTKDFTDPWFVRGNDYRLQFLEGRYKNGVTPGCAGCEGGAFGATGPF